MNRARIGVGVAATLLLVAAATPAADPRDELLKDEPHFLQQSSKA